MQESITMAFKSNNASTANSGAIHNQHVGSKHDVENAQAPTRQKKCTKERVSCVNCGREHQAWQKRECHTFQKYREEINSK